MIIALQVFSFYIIFFLYFSFSIVMTFLNLVALSRYYLLRTFKMTFSHLTTHVLQTVVRKMADDKALQFTFQHVIASIFLRKYCSFEMIDIILLQRKACRFRPIASVFHLTADTLHIGTQVSNGWLFYNGGIRRQFSLY